MSIKQRYISPKELKEFNGRDGKPAYVAYKGKVYDVSNSTFWKEGRHQGRHFAGEDLTPNMLNAPHHDDVLTKLPVVAEFRVKDLLKDTLIGRVEKSHPHSMVVHFSIAYGVMVPLLALLFIITKQTSFETASYYILVGGFLATIAGGLSGLFSWRVTYEGVRSRVFIRKIVLSVVLTIAVGTCFIWRTIDPQVLMARDVMSYFYFVLLLCFMPVVTLLGRYGGKIVFL